jgi:RNA polymerase sigma-70 factor (ECF subfamily)
MNVVERMKDGQLLLDGGDRAMTELVGRYERPLFRFIFNMVGDLQTAEDLFQETFMRLHKYRNSYDATARLRPYLYRIAVNVAREAMSRRSSRPNTASLDRNMNGAAFAERLPSTLPGPDTIREGDEMRSQVRAAVMALPETEREVVHLRVSRGLKFAEIAEATGVPVATAKSRMLYAIRRLRPVLERYIRRGVATRKDG